MKFFSYVTTCALLLGAGGCAQVGPPAQARAAAMASSQEPLASDLAELTRQAEAGRLDAQFALAQRHERGIGTERSYETAHRWYLQAAQAGHVPSQFFVGAMYASSRGTAGDIPEAIRWYRKAADAGYPDALYPVAYAYENGLGGLERDNTKALQWYQAAAAQGNRFAYQRLAKAYRQGELGVLVDAELAGQWQSKANLASEGRMMTVPVGKQ